SVPTPRHQQYQNQKQQSQIAHQSECLYYIQGYSSTKYQSGPGRLSPQSPTEQQASFLSVQLGILVYLFLHIPTLPYATGKTHQRSFLTSSINEIINSE